MVAAGSQTTKNESRKLTHTKLSSRKEATVNRIGLGVLAALGAVFLATSAMAQMMTAPKDLVEGGKLTYGTAASFAPFEFVKDGKPTGFDIEFGAAIAAKLRLKPNIMNMDFKGLIPALQGKRIDIINSAMYINPQRAQQVDFIPYMRIGNEILVKKGNPHKVQSRDDLCGLKIAVTLGAIEETYARAVAKSCAAAHKPEPHILTLPTAQDSALSLRQGRADAMFDSTPGAAELVDALPNVYQIAGKTFEANTKIGIAVRKGDAQMKAAIEKAMHAVVEDGTYAALMKKYNLPMTGSLF
jgi:polar amino acid transport system substrate-binding protein